MVVHLYIDSVRYFLPLFLPLRTANPERSEGVVSFIRKNMQKRFQKIYDYFPKIERNCKAISPFFYRVFQLELIVLRIYQESILAVQLYPVLVYQSRSKRLQYSLGYYNKVISTTTKAGYWNPNNKKWNNVGSVGYVNMSKVNENDNVYELKWNNDNANINRNNQKFPSPFLAFEHCLPCKTAGFICLYFVWISYYLIYSKHIMMLDATKEIL